MGPAAQSSTIDLQIGWLRNFAKQILNKNLAKISQNKQKLDEILKKVRGPVLTIFHGHFVSRIL
jgi:hypothetical protein